MLPIYFFSIAVNALSGYILAFGKEEAEGGNISFNLNGETTRLFIGALSIIIGLLKLLSPVEGNTPVAGDLIPALAGISGGFILVFEFYRHRTTLDTSGVERIVEFIAKNRKIAGFFCMAAAVLHLFFFKLLFL
ncbi:MAG: hypothetical protein LBB72_00640 [Spirochaetaceae bacterium]|jgi:hypothetical protein|nr:hypothetical protein [Spirochaetaceae bacterium]